MAGMAAGGGGRPHLKPAEKVRVRVKARARVRVSSGEDLRHALEQRGRDWLAIVSDDAAREGDVQLGHRHEGACDVRDHLAVLEVRVRPVVIARVVLRVRAARRVDALIPRALGMGSEGRVQRKQCGGHRKREQALPGGSLPERACRESKSFRGGRCRREPAVRGAATARAHCGGRAKLCGQRNWRQGSEGFAQDSLRATERRSGGLRPVRHKATCRCRLRCCPRHDRHRLPHSHPRHPRHRPCRPRPPRHPRQSPHRPRLPRCPRRYRHSPHCHHAVAWKPLMAHPIAATRCCCRFYPRHSTQAS
jgi:hypothetical protein